MSERLKSLQRIVALQAQRKRMAEWKLAEIETRRSALVGARAELGSFMQEENLAGPMALLAMKQVRRLAEREAQAVQEQACQRDAVNAAARRHRLAERIADQANAEHRAVDERRSLERLIEEAIGRLPNND